MTTLSDAQREKNRALEARWSEAAEDLSAAFEPGSWFGDLCENVAEICRERPWAAIRVASADDITPLTERITELVNDELFAGLVKETRELAVRLRRED